VALPTIDVTDDADICAGQPYTLSATGGLTYSWSPATGLNSSIGASVSSTISAPISYIVTGIDGNGCVNSTQVSLGIIPQPQLSAQSVSMICPGADVLLTASGSDGDYAWLPTTALNNTSGTSVIASPMTTTQYTVTLTDACGVELQAQVNVPVEQLYTVNAGGDTDFCVGEVATIQADIIGSNPSITWLNGSAVLAGENDEILSVTEPGTYAIQVETPLGCVYDDAIIVNEIAYPTFYLADTLSFCQGSFVTLNIPGSWDQVLWSTGTQAASIDVAIEGDYNVTVTNDGCATDDEVHVYRVNLPVIQLGPNIQICQGQSASLSAGFNGQWSTGATADSIVVASSGTYSFEYSEEGCVVSDVIDVLVNPLPYIDAATTQFGCIDQEYTIIINDYSAGIFEWSDGTQSPYLNVNAPGDYWFMVTNQCGSAVESITVVLEDCEESVYVPTCFTPDNDGVNDAWKVIARNINSMSTRVFNRWGEVVFQSNDLEPVWTGGYNSGDTFVADGLYFFQIEFERRDGQKDLREGSMFMIR
jgi:gliding motility-associated-like protein